MTEPSKEMSRAAMTAWIVGTLVAIALVGGLTALYFATRLDPSDPYAKCQTLFGKDQSCAGEVARKRLMRLPY